MSDAHHSLNANSAVEPSGLRIGLAQLNSTVGDILGNVERILDAAKQAHESGCELVVFPEMAITGYPLEDLVLSTDIQQAAATAATDLATDLATEGLGDLTLIVGTLGLTATGKPTNEAIVIANGQIQASYSKRHLPTYGVFDEGRVFTAGTEPLTIEVTDKASVALVICEDLWRADDTELSATTEGADVLVSVNASPFEVGKTDARAEVVQRTTKATNTPLAYVNSVGTQDELIFDGKSMFVDREGIIQQGPGFRDTVLVADLNLESGEFAAAAVTTSNTGLVKVDYPSTRTSDAEQQSTLEDIYLGLVQSVRDFVHKCGLESVAIGLSGGIDSALVAAIAVDALGPERVFGLSMPSGHSSDHSKDDAHDLAERTGLNLRTVAIESLVEAYQDSTSNAGIELTGLAVENLQARIRGMLLMALSNSEGPMVLATGNKSELAVGYSTIYGDAVGGYAPLKDVYKTIVWDLARWRNANCEGFENQTPPIPESSIEKPPSAELRPGQLDSDSLPDYDVLDGILARYIDDRAQLDAIVTAGYDASLVREIISKTNLAEYKRRQYPPGPKVTKIAFGRDRRMPIANRFKSN